MSLTSLDIAQPGNASTAALDSSQQLAYGDSPGGFLFDRGIEAVLFVAGASLAGIVALWDSTAEDRAKVTEWIGQGLSNIGQYTQDNVEAVQNFLSEKSLEGKEPGRPTAENTNGEFEPPSRGNTTGRVQGGPMSGKEGWVDDSGNIWVPTNGRAAHGGEHWDVQQRDGSGHSNVYPGGHVR